MNIQTYRRKLTAITAVFAVMFFSCTEENSTEYIPPASGETLVTVVIKAPGGGSPATKALTEDQENDVKHIDVLLFEPGGIFHSSAKSNKVNNNGNGSNLKNFTVDLKEGTYGYGNPRKRGGYRFCCFLYRKNQRGSPCPAGSRSSRGW